jgi:hypothetical protein
MLLQDLGRLIDEREDKALRATRRDRVGDQTVKSGPPNLAS